MFPMPKSLPPAHADRRLDDNGGLAEASDRAAKVAAFVPCSLTELSGYAALLRQARAPAA
jgi:hypothetical protein